MRLAWAANESQFYSSRLWTESSWTAFVSPRLGTRIALIIQAGIGSARDRCSAQGSFFGWRLHDSARFGSTLQVGTRVTWLGLTRLGSARLSCSGFHSSPFLAQAQLGAPNLGWGINSMLDFTQSGLWLGHPARDQVGDRLGTRDSGFASAWAWKNRSLFTTYLVSGNS